MYVRKLAAVQGQSLNQVIISELSERAGVGKPDQTLLESLDWFIGKGMDDETARILDEIRQEGKERARKQLNEPLDW